MHTFIPDTSIQKETGIWIEHATKVYTTIALKQTAQHALFWRKKGKNREKGRKIETKKSRRTQNSYTHSDWSESDVSIVCKHFIQSPHSNHHFTISFRYLCFVCCFLLIKIRDICHSQNIFLAAFKDGCDINEFAYNRNKNCYNHWQGLNFAVTRKCPASRVPRGGFFCLFRLNLCLKMNYAHQIDKILRVLFSCCRRFLSRFHDFNNSDKKCNAIFDGLQRCY